MYRSVKEHAMKLKSKAIGIKLSSQRVLYTFLASPTPLDLCAHHPRCFFKPIRGHLEAMALFLNVLDPDGASLDLECLGRGFLLVLGTSRLHAADRCRLRLLLERSRRLQRGQGIDTVTQFSPDAAETVQTC